MLLWVGYLKTHGLRIVFAPAVFEEVVKLLWLLFGGIQAVVYIIIFSLDEFIKYILQMGLVWGWLVGNTFYFG